MQQPVPSGPKFAKRAFVTSFLVVVAAAAMAVVSPWALSAVLIAGCGVFVAFEFALVKVSMRTLERDAAEGQRGAVTLVGMKHEMNALLAACQFGITTTSLGLTLALEPAIHHALSGYSQLASSSTALAMAGGAFFHVTFGELVPKGLALVVPKRVLYASAPFMLGFRLLAVPFIKTCNSIANLVVRVLTGRNPDSDGHHEESVEIREALVQAYTSGELKPQQLQVMRNVLAFSDRTVREVMTPAREVVMLDLTHSWEHNMRVAEDNGFSRFPVCNGSSHDVVGYTRRADILRAEIQGQRDLRALVLPIERRPETAPLGRVNVFQGTPMIAAFDEHDSFVGLATAEDFVEQIVGEIYDDTDDVEAPVFRKLEDGSVRLSGSTLLTRAAEELRLPEFEERPHDVDTVGGLVLQRLARQPRPGDEIQLTGYRVVVEDSKGFRVLSVLLRPDPIRGDDDAD